MRHWNTPVNIVTVTEVNECWTTLDTQYNTNCMRCDNSYVIVCFSAGNKYQVIMHRWHKLHNFASSCHFYVLITFLIGCYLLIYGVRRQSSEIKKRMQNYEQLENFRYSLYFTENWGYFFLNYLSTLFFFNNDKYLHNLFLTKKKITQCYLSLQV